MDGNGGVGEELEIRRFETGLGNLIVDWMLESAKPYGAESAFYNSGSFRLNRNLAAGPARGQDGYTMLTKKMPEVDLKQQTIERLRAAGAQGVAPTVDGRICDATRPGPCLAVGP
ncbi:hypothetical protein [Nannocystis pusilla]|uniref:hypothetical protein n=1 Tax=Nannocystis pusilla TaxID=889268 RepID=UPI003DA3A496